MDPALRKFTRPGLNILITSVTRSRPGIPPDRPAARRPSKFQPTETDGRVKADPQDRRDSSGDQGLAAEHGLEWGARVGIAHRPQPHRQKAEQAEKPEHRIGAEENDIVDESRHHTSTTVTLVTGFFPQASAAALRAARRTASAMASGSPRF